MITIGKYQFNGPFNDIGSLTNDQGIYVILGRGTYASSWDVVDIGQSGDGVYNRVSNHDREPCWNRQGHSYRAYAVLYTPGYTEAQRCMIERELRDQFQPACGTR